MDFLIRTAQYIDSELSLANPVEPGILADTGKSVAIRDTPGNVPNRYMKDKIYEVGFQILVRDSSFVGAINTTSAITNLLDELPKGSIVSRDGSFLFITSQVTTLPNMVEKSNEGYIYTALFRAELQIL